LKGNGRNNTALTTEKIAVLAPMPSASVITATAVNPGCLSKLRAPKRMSFSNVSMASSQLVPFGISGFRFSVFQGFAVSCF
jgi:hypothetical protein